MELRPFFLERFFARHEFTAPYLLSSSDCDGWSQAEVLAAADPEARRLWDGLTLGYTDSRGLPALRQEIASLYRGVDPDHVVTAAPQELVWLAMNALLKPGDHVVCTHPGYQSLYEVALSLGCRVDRWQPDEAAGWRFDLGRLEALLKADTKLVVVNFPHNPTGALPPRADFEALAALLRGRGIRLFSDEMYRFLELDSAERLPSACELYERSLTLGGMSKAFGMAGLRVGWLVVPDRAVRERVAELRDYTTICGAAPSEVLALMGLRAKDAVLARHRRRIARNLGLLDAFFARQDRLFRWVRPKAGTVAFPAYRGDDGAPAFCDRLVAEAGVVLLPSAVFEYEAPHVRFGFGRENMPEALARLEAWLETRRS